MLVILNCIRGLESFEEGARSPSAQTLRDRLNLTGEWLEYYHCSVWKLAILMVKKFQRFHWWISIDETYVPFFGDRKKLNKKLKKNCGKSYVHGYRADTAGATGSFCFLVISLCCCKIRIPIAIKLIAVNEGYEPWLKPHLHRLLKLVHSPVVLADRGFGKAVWFYAMLDDLGARYVVRMPLRKKEHKNKVAAGITKFQHWMKDSSNHNKVLLTIHVARDENNREYILASNIDKKTPKELLQMYLHRWDLENIFKDSDRIQLPTSSPNPQMRLFCVVVAFFLFTLWQVKPLFHKASLRHFVKRAIEILCTLLQCIITPFGVIIHQTS